MKSFLPSTFPEKEGLNLSEKGAHKLLSIKGKHQLDVSGRACLHSQSAEIEPRLTQNGVRSYVWLAPALWAVKKCSLVSLETHLFLEDGNLLSIYGQ